MLTHGASVIDKPTILIHARVLCERELPCHWTFVDNNVVDTQLPKKHSFNEYPVTR